MRKIHKLTAAQLALIPVVRDKWIKIGLDTTPVDHDRVLEILGRLYAIANKPTPKFVVNLNSPLHVSNVIANLRLEGNPAAQQVSQAIRKKLSRQIRVEVLRQAIGSIFHTIKDQASRASDQVRDQVYHQVYEHVHIQTRDQNVSAISWEYMDTLGQFDPFLPACDFLGQLGYDFSKLSPCFDLAENCGLAVLFWDWAFISAKPEFIRRDERGRLHCETGAAIRYPDSFSVFAIHGVRVPEKVVVSPKSLTIQEIEFELNAEVQRVMIDRYGMERFLVDSGAVEMHRDDFGVLYRKELFADEPLVMVKVVNSTPEPDGSFKDYFLRVPPTMERARQAVAWTFGKEESNYAPALQT